MIEPCALLLKSANRHAKPYRQPPVREILLQFNQHMIQFEGNVLWSVQHFNTNIITARGTTKIFLREPGLSPKKR